jgi:hypothetical protein
VSVPSSTGGEVSLHHLLKMEPTQSSETSAFNTQTPWKCPEDNSSNKKFLTFSKLTVPAFGMMVVQRFIMSVCGLEMYWQGPTQSLT